MSADLILYAAPNEDQWRAQYAVLTGAEFLTPDAEDLVRGADGYLRYRDHPGQDGGPAGLTFGEDSALRVELGLYGRLDQCWVGQVSWMKAALDGDVDRYVPAPVRAVAGLIGSGRLLTPGLAGELMVAMNLPNTSIYGRRHVYRTSQRVYDAREQEWRRASSSERRWCPTPLGHRQLLDRKPENNSTSCGVVRRQVLKRWLAAHQGAWLVAESE